MQRALDAIESATELSAVSTASAEGANMDSQSSQTDRIISNVFGTMGAVCWSIQLTPQIILNYRRHSASGLSSAFMLLWACAGVPLGVYNIVADFNVALQVQPQILTALSLVTWAQCYYYERQWTLRKAVAAGIAIAGFMAGVEVALVYAVRIAVQSGTDWPSTLMAVLAALFLALGVLEQYIAIWKNQSVEGISFLFCGIDALGDVTSIVSVCFERKLNILALVTYSVEFILWMGVFACGAYFKLIPWTKRQIERRQCGLETDGSEPEPTERGISLHELPSSNSVFQTPSGMSDVRARRQRHQPAIEPA